jgi:hypothetical protein
MEWAYSMKVGFTGSREGMSRLQKEQFVLKLFELSPTEFHHGDCEGADAEAHDIVREFFPTVIIHVYPPKAKNKQAFKQGDIWYTPAPYLERDRKIVDSTECLIGAPLSDAEQLRSGTWATIRHARKTGKPNFVLKR